MICSKRTIKENNTSAVFDLIAEQMPLSRAQIAKRTGLSPTTVSALTRDMLTFGVIHETGLGDAGASGRRPVLLEIDPRGAYMAALEVGVDALTCALFDARCRPVAQCTHAVADFNALGGQIRDSLAALLRQAQVPAQRMLGLSVGIPAILDPDSQRILSSTILPVDAGTDFLSPVKEAYPGRIVSAGNETSYSAYAEWKAAPPHERGTLVYIDVGVGIGAGLILDGDIYTGRAGSAGELGHMSVDAGGPRCKCGARGCLEVLASLPAALQKMMYAVVSGRDEALSRRIGGNLNNLNAEVFFEAFREGNPTAVEIAQDMARTLAVGVNNVVNLFDPGAVVLGGPVTGLGPGFLALVNGALGTIALRGNGPAIRYPAIEGRPVLLGGAQWTLGRVVGAIGAIVNQ